MVFEDYDFTSADAILEFAKRLTGRSLAEMVDTSNVELNSAHKGDFGSLVETIYFDIHPGNSPLPDFPDAGVELKTTGVTPARAGGFRAKERLVLSMIDFEKINFENWDTSSFLIKNKTLLIMFYLYEKAKPLLDRVFVLEPVLYSIPPEDFAQIHADWLTIQGKVKLGLAHEISEGDTFYLAACRKGSGGPNETLRKQPNSDIGAKARAFSFKPSYVNQIINRQATLNSHNLGDQPLTVEQATTEKLSKFKGQSLDEICEELNFTKKKSKSFNRDLVLRMLGGSGKSIQALDKADIQIKTIRTDVKGKPRESMSFRAFKYLDLAKETWEDSGFFESLEKKFLFVIFEVDQLGNEVFKRFGYWNMPFEDREEARIVWEKAKSQANLNAKLMPALTESRVAHVRPKARNSLDTNLTLQGDFLVKKAFWLNKNYIESVISKFN